jgi:hypothetical protein
MSDAYRYCAETLLEIFQRAMRDHKLSKEFEAELQEEFDVWSEGTDSVPFITWCANKINGGSLSASFPGIGTPPQTVKVMSPDGHTDWTLAAWWIRGEVDDTLTFNADILQTIERRLSFKYALAQLWRHRGDGPTT